MKQCFFAVDLGATSGRTILGAFTPAGLELEEVNRFPNHLIEAGGHLAKKYGIEIKERELSSEKS